jgi:hypothetical protein
MSLKYYCIVLTYFLIADVLLEKHRIFDETFMLLMYIGFCIWLSGFFQSLDCISEKTKLLWKQYSDIASAFFINFASFFIFSKVW